VIMVGDFFILIEIWREEGNCARHHLFHTHTAGPAHMNAAKKVLRYVQSCKKIHLRWAVFESTQPGMVYGYADASFADNYEFLDYWIPRHAQRRRHQLALNQHASRSSKRGLNAARLEVHATT
jgi:hypothetical protein